LTTALVALKADNTKLTAKILSVWKDLDSAKVEQAAADQRADRAEAATSQRAKEISVLQTERDQLRQQLAVALAAAKPASPASGSDAPAKALAAAEEARTKTASELETVRRDLAAARAAQADLKAQITKLSDENASLKSKGSAGRDAVRDVSAARAQVERDAAELKTLRTRITELSAENQRLELEAGKLADTGRRLEQAQSSVARLQGEIAELQSKIAALAPEGSAEELARLKQELARAKQAVDMTVRSYALVRQENDQLKARLDKIQQAVGAVQDAASKPAPAPAAARP
jgi:chromosome segregation ATPase